MSGRTAVEAAKPNMIREDDPKADEFKEVGEELPPPNRDEVDPNEDPRLAIANKHREKHRNFDEDEEPAPGEGGEPAENQNIDMPPGDSETVEIVVYGKAYDVPREKVEKAGGIQAYQKEVAVSEGFKQVAQQKNELDLRAQDLLKREEDLKRRENELKSSESQDLPSLDDPNKQADPPQGDQNNVSDLIKKSREALLDGDDEGYDAALAELVNISKGDSRNNRDTSVDVSEIEQRAAERAVNELEQRTFANKVHKAREQLYIDHPELKKDRRLFLQVDQESSVVMRENPGMEPHEVLTKAYDNVKNWLGNDGAQQEDSDTALDQKRDEKRSFHVPRSQGGRNPAPEKPQPESRSSYVERVRKQRGLE